MSRTFKDLPFWLWQAHRLNAPTPPSLDGPWSSFDGNPIRDRSEFDEWRRQFPLDPAVRTQKARRRGQRVERRLAEASYRAYVRDRIAHGDYDGIEGPSVITGYWWWW